MIHEHGHVPWGGEQRIDMIHQMDKELDAKMWMDKILKP
jgi:hypothetical protein